MNGHINPKPVKSFNIATCNDPKKKRDLLEAGFRASHPHMCDIILRAVVVQAADPINRRKKHKPL